MCEYSKRPTNQKQTERQEVKIEADEVLIEKEGGGGEGEDEGHEGGRECRDNNKKKNACADPAKRQKL